MRKANLNLKNQLCRVFALAFLGLFIGLNPVLSQTTVSAGTYPALINAINSVNGNPSGGVINIIDNIVIGTSQENMPEITKPVVIKSSGGSWVLSLAPGYNERHLTVGNFPVDVTLENLIFRGHVSYKTTQGGGIIHKSTSGGSLTLTNCVVENCSLIGSGKNFGGGVATVERGSAVSYPMIIIRNSKIQNNYISGSNTSSYNLDGGGVYAAGALIVEQSTISGNQANSNGLRARGGGLFAHERLELLQSTVSGNSVISARRGSAAEEGVTSGGGVYIHGLSASIVSHSTFNDNSVNGNITNKKGGEMELYGGGLFLGGAANSSVQVFNSTFFGNSVNIDPQSNLDCGNGSTAFAKGGGIATFDGAISIVNSTIVKNILLTTKANCSDAVGGGGLAVVRTGTITVKGSIISGNVVTESTLANGQLSNVMGFTDSPAYLNLIDGGTGNNAITYEKIFGTNTLADNGGLTWTVKILENGPAQNKISFIDNPWVPIDDQRGINRYDQGCMADIGSFEIKVTTPPDPMYGEYHVNGSMGGRNFTNLELAILALNNRGTRDEVIFTIYQDQTLPSAQFINSDCIDHKIIFRSKDNTANNRIRYNGAGRHLTIARNIAVEIEGLNFDNDFNGGGGIAHHGGSDGTKTDRSSLLISRSTIQSCENTNTNTTNLNNPTAGIVYTFTNIPLTIRQSTFTNNYADVANNTVSVICAMGALTVENATFAENELVSSSNIIYAGTASAAKSIKLSTFYGTGSGRAFNLSGNPTVQGCIILGFSASTPAIPNSPGTGPFNLTSGTASNVFASTSLANNGGPTQTLLIKSADEGGLAHNRISPTVDWLTGIDQRDSLRPQDCAGDIGAVELSPPVTSMAMGGVYTVGAGKYFSNLAAAFAALNGNALGTKAGVTFELYENQILSAALVVTNQCVVHKLTICSAAGNTFTITQNAGYRHLNIQRPIAVELNNIILKKGSSYYGGGVNHASTGSNSSLTLIDVYADNCSSGNDDGGAVSSSVPLTIRRSSFSNNRTDKFGGAVHAGSSLMVENSTFYGNYSGNGGAIWSQAGSTTTIIFATIVNNTTAADIGGLFINNPTTSGTATIRGSIFLGNKNSTNTTNSNVTIPGGSSSAPYNISVGTVVDVFGSATLQLNDGLTPSLMILKNGPAHNKIPAAVTGLPAEDQRGFYRPRENTFDVGAIERREFTPGIISSVGERSCEKATKTTITDSIPASPGEGGSIEYRWFQNGELIDGANGPTYTPPADLPAGTYVYTREVRESDPSAVFVKSQGSWTLVVKKTPEIQSYSPDPIPVICSDAELNLSFTGTLPGTTFTWTQTTTGTVSGASDGSGTIIRQTLSGDPDGGTVTYRVTPVLDGCSGTPKNYTVTVLAPVGLAYSFEDTTQIVCARSAIAPITFNPTGAATGATLVFTSGSPADFHWENNAIPVVLTGTPTTAGVYKYKITTRNANNCTDSTITGTITVTATPDFTIADPAPVCAPGTVDIDVSNLTITGDTSMVKGNWKYYSDAALTTELLTTVITAEGKHTYYIKGTNTNTTIEGGCSGVDSITVFISPRPEVDIVNLMAPDTTLCYGGKAMIALRADTTNATQIAWTSLPAGGKFIPDSLKSSVQFQPGEEQAGKTIVIYANASNGYCPVIKDSIAIFVLPEPERMGLSIVSDTIKRYDLCTEVSYLLKLKASEVNGVEKLSFSLDDYRRSNIDVIDAEYTLDTAGTWTQLGPPTENPSYYYTWSLPNVKLPAGDSVFVKVWAQANCDFTSGETITFEAKAEDQCGGTFKETVVITPKFFLISDSTVQNTYNIINTFNPNTINSQSGNIINFTSTVNIDHFEANPDPNYEQLTIFFPEGFDWLPTAYQPGSNAPATPIYVSVPGGNELRIQIQGTVSSISPLYFEGQIDVSAAKCDIYNITSKVTLRIDTLECGGTRCDSVFYLLGSVTDTVNVERNRFAVAGNSILGGTTLNNWDGHIPMKAVNPVLTGDNLIVKFYIDVNNDNKLDGGDAYLGTTYDVAYTTVAVARDGIFYIDASNIPVDPGKQLIATIVPVSTPLEEIFCEPVEFPIAILTGTDTLCERGTGTYKAPAGTDISRYIWRTDASGGATIMGAGAEVTVRWNNPGTHKIYVSYYRDTVLSDETYHWVYVRPLPKLTSTTTPPALCSGDNFNYTATSDSASTTFAWERLPNAKIDEAVTTGIVALINEPLTNNSSDTAIVAYKYILTNKGCDSTYYVKVVVNPKPGISSSSTVPAICSGGVFNYDPVETVSNTTFTWTRTLPAGITGDKGTSGTGNPMERLTNATEDSLKITYVFTPSITKNGITCNGDPYSVEVYVYPTPVLKSALTQNACNNTEFTYTPTGNLDNITYTWTRISPSGISTPDGTGTGEIRETLTNTTDSVVTVTYKYTLSINGNSCPNTQEVKVRVAPTPRMILTSPVADTICSGETFTYTPTSPTKPVATFAWARAGDPDNPANSGPGAIAEVLRNTTLNPIVVTYVYTITANGCDATQEVKVRVNPLPTLSQTATEVEICEGGAVELSDYINSSNGTRNYFITNPYEVIFASRVSPTATTEYGIYVSSTQIPRCANSDTLYFTVKVNPKPVINVGPDTTICQGTTYTNIAARVKIEGSPTSLNWKTDGAGVLSDSTVLAFTYTPNIADTLVNFTLTAKEGDCESTGFFTLIYNPYATADTIVARDTAICMGDKVKLEVSSLIDTDSTAIYHWYDGNTSSANLVNTGRTYETPILWTTTTYYIGVSNADFCENEPAKRKPLTVTVYDLPSASFQIPANVCEGYTVDLNTFVTNVPYLDTVIYYTDKGRTMELSSPDVLITKDSTFYIRMICFASPLKCSVDTLLKITMIPAPTVDAGNNVAICSGGTFTTTGANATNGASYLWSGGTGTWAGETTLNTATYTPTPAEAGATLKLRLTVYGTSPCDPVTDSMYLSVQPAAKITMRQDTVSVCPGTSVKVSADTANVTTPILWSKGNTLNGTITSPNDTAAFYNAVVSDTLNGGGYLYFTVAGISPCGNKTDSVYVRVWPLSGVDAGKDTVICAGPSLTVIGKATNAVSVEWTGGSGTWTNSTKDTAVYTPAVGEKGSSFKLYFTAINSYGCSNTDSLELTISNDEIVVPEIESSNNGKICGPAGSTVLRVTNTDKYSSSATYQWYKDGVSLGSGATSPVLILTGAGHEGNYKVLVEDGTCEAFSGVGIDVTYDATNPITAPAIVTSNSSLCGPDGVAVLRLSNTGAYTSPTYQWYKDGLPLAGETDSVLTVVGNTSHGSYTLQVTDGGCSSLSNVITLTDGGASGLTTPAIVTSNSSLCGPDGVAVLRLSNTGSYTSPTYQWYKDGLPLAGETDSVLTVVGNTSHGSYTLQVTDGGCSSLSNVITLTDGGASGLTTPAIVTSNSSLCGPDGVAVLRLSNTGAYTSPTYQWYKDGLPLAGETDSVLTVVGNTSHGSYTLQVTDGGCSSLSNVITLTDGGASGLTTPAIVTSNSSLCGPDGVAVLRLSNTGSYTSPTYQWYKDGLPLAGETDSVLTVVGNTSHGSYTLQVTDGGCSSLSNVITLTDGGASGLTTPAIVTSNSSLCGPDGVAVLRLSNTGSYTSPTYQWYKDGLPLAGETDSVLTVVGNTSHGSYTLQVTDGGCSSLSNVITLTDGGASGLTTPAIVTSNSSLCGPDGVAVLRLSNTGSYTSPTYQWYKDGLPLAGETDSVLTVVGNTSHGTYTLQVTDGGCSSLSNVITLTDGGASGLTTPAIVTSNSSLCGPDGVAVLRLSNTGAYTSPTYQWYKDGLPLSGETDSVLTVVGNTSHGSYTLQVTDGGCSSLSNVITLTDGGASGLTTPAIVTSNSSLCGPDGVAVLRLSNTGSYTSPAYQWYKDGLPLSGETDSVLTVVGNTSHGTYTLQVTDGGCSSLSNVITLTDGGASGLTAPAIVTSNSSLCGPDGVAVLRLSNTGSYTSPAYQWYKDGLPLAGETDSVLTVVGNTSHGSYTLQVTDGGCSSLSNVITLTDGGASGLTAPAIVTSNSSLCGPDGVAVLRLSNTGSYTSPAYQWYKDGLPLAGETDSVLTVVGNTSHGSYTLQVTDGGCSSLSNVITLTDGGASGLTTPAIVTSNSSLCGPDGVAVLRLSNTGSYTSPTYQWYKDGLPLAGETDSVLTVVGNTSHGSYTLQVTDGGCSSLSNVITLTDGGASGLTTPAIVTSNSSLCGPDGVAVLRLSNTGSYTSPTYQWYKDGLPLAGETDSVLTVVGNTSHGSYTLQVTDGGCSSLSNVITLTDGGASGLTTPAIVTSNSSLCGPDGVAVLRLSNTGSYTSPTYQWYKDGLPLAGETDSVLTVVGNTSHGSYTLQVTDGGCSSLSNVITLTDGGASGLTTPAIVTSNSSLCGPDGVAVLRLSNTGAYTSPTYQWYKDGLPLAGETDSVLTVVGNTSHGSYTLQVTDGGCSSLSNVITLTDGGASGLTTPAIVTSNSSLCGPDGVAVLRLSNTGSYTSPTYQWYKDGLPLAGETDSVLTVVGNTSHGSYTLQVTDGGCSSLSNVITLTDGGASGLTTPAIVTSNSSLCGPDGVAVLRLSNTGSYTSPTYQWYKDGLPLAGETDSVLTVVGNTSHGSYTLQVTDGGCSSLSNVITLTDGGASGLTTPAIVTSNSSLCGPDGVAVLRLSNTGSYTSPTYQWYKDGLPLAGETDSVLTVVGNTSHGSYTLQVTDGGCSSLSNVITLTDGGASGLTTPAIVTSNSSLCGPDGVAVLRLSNTGSYTSPTYQWYKDGLPLAGETDSVLTVVGNTSHGSYTLQVTDGGCSSLSNVITLTDGGASGLTTPAIVTSNSSLCGPDGVAVLRLSNTGAYTSPTYQWYKDGLPLAGETDSVLTVVGNTSHGSYTLQVTDGGCSSLSNVITLTDGGASGLTTPAIVTSNSSLCGPDGVAVLRLSNTGVYTSPTYQWYKDGLPLAGETDSVLTVVGNTSHGSYTLQVTDGGCSSLSNVITLTDGGASGLTAPAIVTSNSSLCGPDGVAVLRLSNTGSYTSPTYQWYKDGLPLAGETDSVLTVVGNTSHGSYTLQVTDGGCSSLSNVITLTDGGASGLTTPAIVTSNSSLCGPDGVAVLRLSNTGSYTSPTYQWYKDGLPLAGETDSVLTVVGNTSHGSYTLQVTDGGCSSLSNVITLTDGGASGLTTPAIVTSNSSLCGPDGVAVLRLSNTGVYTSPTYQWYKDGLPLAGETDSVLTVVGNTSHGSYTLQVTDGGCSSLSNVITLTDGGASGLTAPAIVTSNSSLCGPDGVAVLRLSNTGSYTSPTYQWYKDGLPLAGETDSVLTVVGNTSHGSYTLQVTDGGCSSLSNVITLTDGGASGLTTPAIVTSNSSLCGPDGVAVLRLSNTGSYTSPTYQWYKDGLPLAGETDSVLTVVGNTSHGSYTLQVTDGGCSSLSNVITLTDGGASGLTTPVIEASNRTLCGPTGVSLLSINNLGDYSGSQTYQWYKDGIAMIGETNSTLIVTGNTNAGEYTVQVIDNGCSEMSSAIILQNGGDETPATPSITASNSSLCGVAGVAVLRLTNASAYASYINVTYQWYKDGLPLSGQTDSVLTVIGNASYGSYTLQVTADGCSSSLSNVITLTDGGASGLTAPAIVTSNSSLCGPDGVAVLRLSNTGSYTSPTYQWYKDGLPLSGETDSVLTVVGNTSHGTYTLQVTDGGCSSLSNVITLTDGGASGLTTPAIVTSNSSLCGPDGVAVLRLSNTGSYTSPTYQWYKDGLPLAGETDSVLTVVGNTSHGTYTLQVTDGGCSSLSNVITLTDGGASGLTTPAIVTSNSSLCGPDGVAVLRLSNTGAYTSPTYQWYKDGLPLSGETDSVLTVVGNTSHGSYTLQVTDGGCSSLSNVITLTDGGASGLTTPAIVTSNSSLCGPDGVAVLRLSNTGSYTSPAYQWYKDGLPLSGETDSVLTVVGNTSHGTYTLQVTDGGCSSLSNVITLTDGGASGLTAPAIVTSNSSLCGPDGVAVLRLSNTGSYTSPAYQWYKDGLPLAGETDSVLTVVGNTSHGSYTLQVTDGGCSSLSNVITLTDGGASGLTAPAIVTSNSSLCGPDGVAVLRLSNTGSYTSPAYQWYKDGLPLAGETDSVLTVVGNTSHGSYTLQVTDGGCSSLSNVITLTDGGASGLTTPAIVTSNSSLCGPDGVAVLRLSNTGSYTSPTYQWYKDGLPLAGETDSVLTVVGNTSHGSYTLQVTDGGCSSLSNVITLTDGGASGLTTPAIVTSNSSLCGPDGVAVLRLSNTGSYTSPTYQWYKDGLPLAGETDSVLTVVGNTSHGSYTLQVTDGGCSSLSNVITLTDGGASGLTTPAIVTSNSSLCGPDGVAVLRLSNTGSYTSPTYQWYKDGLPLAGETDSVLTVVGNTSHGSYTLQVTDGGCSSLSNVITLTDGGASGLTAPAIVTSNSSLCGPDGVAVLRLSNTGAYTSPAYQWYKDGLPLSGETDSVLTVVGNTSHGSYTLQVTDGGCSSLSNVITLTDGGASGLTAPAIVTSNSSLCGPDGVAVLRLSNTGSYTSPTYQWYKDGLPLAGETDSVLTVVGNTSHGSYTLQVTDGGCSSLSNVITLTDGGASGLTTPVINATNNGTICGTSVIILSVTNDSVYTTPTYQWYKDGLIFTGATNATLTLNSAADTGFYKVYVVDNSCGAFSNEIKVSYAEAVVLTWAAKTDSLCVGMDSTFAATVNNVPGTGVWSSSSTTVATVGTDGKVIAVSAGTTEIKYVYTSSAGCSDTLKQTLIVSALPDPVIARTAHNTNCVTANGEITITGLEANRSYTINYTYNSTTTQSSTQTSDALGVIQITGLSEGDYSSWEVKDNVTTCVTIKTLSITIDAPAKVIATATAIPTVVCAGDTIKLSTSVSGGDTPYTYLWTTSGGATFTKKDTSIANATPAMSGDYWVVVTDANGCESEPDTVTVTVNTRPTAAISSSRDTLCQGENATITVDLTGTGPWSFNFASGATTTPVTGWTANQWTRSVTPDTTTKYKISGLSDSYCSNADVDSVTVVVMPRPKANISVSSASICEGASDTLTVILTAGSKPWNFTWTDGTNTTTESNITADTVRIPVTPTAVGTTTNYTITALWNAHCTAQAGDITGTAAIYVNARPTSVISAVTTTICEGDSVQIRVDLTGNPNYSFTWTDGTTPMTVTGVTASPYYFWVHPATGTTSYWITALSDNSTCDARPADIRDTVTITVNPRPTATLTGGSTTICQGESTDLQVTLTGTAPFVLTYSDGVKDTTISNITTTTYTITVSPTTTTTYTLKAVSDATSCPADTAMLTGSFTVNVNEAPTLVVSGGDTTQTVCEGYEIEKVIFTYGGSATSAALTFAGGTPTGINITPVGNTVELSGTPTAPGTYTYSVTTVNPYGCSEVTTTGTLVVDETPTLTFTPLSACQDATIDKPMIDAVVSSNGTVSYYTDNTYTAQLAFPFQLTADKWIYVKAASAACDKRDSVLLKMNPLPVITAVAIPPTIQKGRSTTLTASSSIPGTTFTWQPGSLSGESVVVSPRATIIYTVTGITDTTGCEGTAQVEVTVVPPHLRIPNIFTPNNDGYNDVFFIENLDLFENPELVVYNRQQARVYESKNYQNNWDGTGLPDGVYYYILQVRIEGKLESYKGYVHIARSL